jgi:preprotein translocase subunit SecB
MVNFEGSKIIKLNFSNERVEKEGPFSINNRFNMTVDYDEENKHCTCIYEMLMETPDENVDFSLEFKMLGFFSYDGDDKKQIHLEATRTLYPYVQTAVMNLMNSFGYPNFLLPPLDLSEEDVNA